MTTEIKPLFQQILMTNGLRSFEEIMRFSGGTKMREAQGRLTVRLECVPDTTLYLKRHTHPAHDAGRAGMLEWENIKLLSEKGFPCAVPVAVGSGKLDGKDASFLITQAIPDGIPADEFLKENYRVRVAGARIRDKRFFINNLARFTRSFHDAGFHHKDFYLCHLFVRNTAVWDGRFYLIDLQRLGRSYWLRRRWIIKDLAALNYSATPEFATGQDRVRFILEYLGISTLTPRAKRFIRAILRKTERIRRHDAKLLRRMATVP